jgi:hypothetical protein
MDHVRELLDDLARRIAQEEADVRERIKRIEYMADPNDVKDQIREEWHKFQLRVKPMQDEQRFVIKQLVRIKSMEAPAPMVVPEGHARIP